MNFYIADTHFGHENIIRLNNRPFKNIDEMDEILIKNWNNKVKENDDVYILGDFIYKSNKGYEHYFKRLNGNKHLIVGNHDTKLIKQENFRKQFKTIKDILIVNEDDEAIVLCHYPLLEWQGYYRGWKHFYGHIHNNPTETFKIMQNIKNAYNVGADILNYTPCTFKEITQKIKG